MTKINQGFVSEIDQFLQEVDKRYPALSASQQAEVIKYQRIYYLRDTANHPVETLVSDNGFL